MFSAREHRSSLCDSERVIDNLGELDIAEKDLRMLVFYIAIGRFFGCKVACRNKSRGILRV